MQLRVNILLPTLTWRICYLAISEDPKYLLSSTTFFITLIFSLLMSNIIIWIYTRNANTQLHVIVPMNFFYSSYRIFTFGIGHGCSTELVRNIAKASNGKPTFVKDNDRLQSKVVYLQSFRRHSNSYIFVR